MRSVVEWVHRVNRAEPVRLRAAITVAVMAAVQVLAVVDVDVLWTSEQVEQWAGRVLAVVSIVGIWLGPKGARVRVRPTG